MAEKKQNWLGVVLFLAAAILLYELWKNGTLGKLLHFGGSAATGTAQTSTAKTRQTTTTHKASGSSAVGGHYTVQKGESLSSIAAKFGVSLSALEQANPQIENPNLIYPNEVITIPGGSSGNTAGTSGNTGSAAKTAKTVQTTSSGTHTTGSSVTVQKGQTLSAIAAAHGVSLQALLAANRQISDPNLIYPGQTIHLPSGYRQGSTRPTSSSSGTSSFLHFTSPSEVSVSALASDHPVSISGLSAAQVGYLKSLAKAGKLAGVSSNGQPIFAKSNSNANVVYTTHDSGGTYVQKIATEAGSGRTAYHVNIGSTSHAAAFSATTRVAKGQTLSAIAAAHGMSLAALEKVNPQIHNFNLIYPGEEVHL